MEVLPESKFMTREQRRQALYDALSTHILVIDGAMGTMIHSANLTVADYGGPKQDNCPEILCVNRPDVIRDIHKQYLAAGADIIESNSFGSTSVVLADFDLADKSYELSVAAAALAREAADEYSTDRQRRWQRSGPHRVQ